MAAQAGTAHRGAAYYGRIDGRMRIEYNDFYMLEIKQKLTDLYALSKIRKDITKDRYLFCGQKNISSDMNLRNITRVWSRRRKRRRQ